MNEDNEGPDINVENLMAFESDTPPLVLTSQWNGRSAFDYEVRIAFLRGDSCAYALVGDDKTSEATAKAEDGNYLLTEKLILDAEELYLGLNNDIILPELRAKTCLGIVRSVNLTLNSLRSAYDNGAIGDCKLLEDAFSLATDLSEEVVDMLNKDNADHPVHQRYAEIQSAKLELNQA